MHTTKKLAAAFIFTLLISAGLANLAAANPDQSNLIIAMPKEYIHYTITRINGTLWAKIDGTYPLQILTDTDNASSCLPTELSMVFPTPPDNQHSCVNESRRA